MTPDRCFYWLLYKICVRRTSVRGVIAVLSVIISPTCPVWSQYYQPRQSFGGGGDQRLTNSLKSALSFSGGVSSSVCVCKFKLASQMLNICNGGSDLWCRILLSLAEWTQKVVFLPVDWRRHLHGCGFWFSPGHAGPSQNQFKMSIEVTNSCPLRTSALTKSTKHLLESVCPHGPEEERFWCTHHW